MVHRRVTALDVLIERRNVDVEAEVVLGAAHLLEEGEMGAALPFGEVNDFHWGLLGAGGQRRRPDVPAVRARETCTQSIYSDPFIK